MGQGGIDPKAKYALLVVGGLLVLINLFVTFRVSGDAAGNQLPRSVREARQAQIDAKKKQERRTRGAAAASSAADGDGDEEPVAKPSRAPKKLKEDPDRFLTYEHCYAQSDEAETCFYHGALCYDGEKLIVSTREEVGQDLRTSMCYDFRHFVASPSCGYNGPHKRQNLDPSTPLGALQDAVPRMLSYASSRKWGPLGREVGFREVRDDVLLHPAAANISVRWLDGPMYVGGLHHSWLDHTWHFAAATMALFDLKRYNRSAHGHGPGVRMGTGNNANNPVSTLGMAGSWAAPPMDYLLVAGQYRDVEGMKDLRPWIGHLLTMLVQNHTKIVWNSVWKEWGVGPQHWVCAREGAVIGLKPRMFNAIGDAHVWRLLAYNYAGVTAPAKNEWPPRRITLLTRAGTRNVLNIDEVVAELRGTGLELNWIQEMGTLTFQQQVDAMAGTGILFAVHGAGLANVMFMPAHSVVVEMFPYLMYVSMYRDLANAAGLFYYRMPSDKPSVNASGILYEEAFEQKCDGEDRHISSPAAFLDYECNWRSKSSPVLINMQLFRQVLAMAMDDIGCRDSYCEGGTAASGWEHHNMKKKGDT